MTLATLVWFTIAACIVYLVTQDPNVLTWLVLATKVVENWFQRQWFLFIHNPDSPWVRYRIKRTAHRMAQEIMKEIEEKRNV